MIQNAPFRAHYGLLPQALAPLSADAAQYSPLIPQALALEHTAPASLETMAMLAPFGTLERRYAMALSLRALRPDASFVAMAPKDKGGTRLKKELQDFGCVVAEEARRHFRICHTTRPAVLRGLDDAIAAGAPRLVEDIGFISQPGVFSWNRLDTGSKLLAATMPPLQGRGADLGCGFGYLARVALAAPEVQHLILVDIDRRAVACAERNITDPRVTCLWQDVSATGLRELDFVVMNPPFHDAGIEDQTLGQRFLESAHRMLRAGGVCWLTANRHLPYENRLAQLFAHVALQAEADGFKIYKAIA